MSSIVEAALFDKVEDDTSLSRFNVDLTSSSVLDTGEDVVEEDERGGDDDWGGGDGDIDMYSLEIDCFVIALLFT